MSVLFRARVVRSVAGVYSKENEATRRRPGEGVEVKDSRRGGGLVRWDVSYAAVVRSSRQRAGAHEGN